MVWFGKIPEPEPEPTRMVLSAQFRFRASLNLNWTERTIGFRSAGFVNHKPEPEVQMW
jgi:hypothetical protein